MRKSLFLFSLLILCVFLCSTASAIPLVGDLDIDFRTAAWAGANGEGSFGPIDGVTANTYTLFAGAAELYQDSKDGLGIRGGEQDEIDRLEFLWIDLNHHGVGLPYGPGLEVTGVWITDLFDGPDGGHIGEQGLLLLWVGDSFVDFTFSGNDSDQANGEQYVDFGGTYLAHTAIFAALNIADGINPADNEFSVAGFTQPVPEPATMLLLGSGLIGLAGFGRKKFSKK